MKKIMITAGIVLFSASVIAKEMYRAPSTGDSGTYYILKHEIVENKIHKVLTSRIGKGNAYTTFTELKINCESQEFLSVSEGEEDGAKDAPSKPLKDWSSKSQWATLVAGSSKYDLVQYVCKKYK